MILRTPLHQGGGDHVSVDKLGSFDTAQDKRRFNSQVVRNAIESAQEIRVERKTTVYNSRWLSNKLLCFLSWEGA